MAQDKVSLFNIAISSIGSRGVKLSSPDDAGPEAEECRLWYEPARDQVLRAAPWPSAKAYQRLALAATRDSDVDWVSTDPEPGWSYAYALPTECVRPRYLSTYERFTTGNLKTAQGEVPAIFTSAEEPILVFTKRQDNVALWDAQLYMAIANALGHFISGPLHGKLNFYKASAERANELILEARQSAANEDNDQIDVLPEWIQQRGYKGVPRNNNYTYPYGALIGATAGGASAR